MKENFQVCELMNERKVRAYILNFYKIDYFLDFVTDLI